MNRRGFLFGCERLCAVAVVLFALLVALPAHAWIHGVPVSAACSQYAIDNGCAGSTTYVAVPFFQDTNVAYNSAQNGQLPPSPTGAQIAARNAALHKANVNLPGMDYPIGSGNPATKPLISTYPGSANCHYFSTGAHFTGGPMVLCQPPGSGSTAPDTIRNYEMADGAGNCVELDIKPPASGSVVPTDLYFIDLHWLVQGDCFAGSSGQPSDLVYAASTGGVGTVSKLHFISDFADGNFANAPDATTGRVGFIDDLRSGVPGTAFNWPIEMIYTAIQNFGHDPIFGINNASSLVQYSYFRHNCLSGPSLCHQEIAEYTSNNGPWGSTTPGLRSAVYDGNVFIADSTYLTVAQTTAAFYFSSGNNGNANYSLAQATNNLVIQNSGGCSNSNTTTPYGPNNPCVGGTLSSEAFLALDWITSAQVLTVSGNVFDGTGSNFAYAANWNNYNAGGAPVASVAGTTLTITTPATNPAYSNGLTQSPLPRSQFWTGMMVHDTNAADGFTDAKIASFGTYTNTGSLATPCVIGTNAGCGTLNLDPAISQPTLSSITTLVTYAGVGTVNWSNNWSIGGAYGSTVKALNFVPFGSVNNGQVPLP